MLLEHVRATFRLFAIFVYSTPYLALQLLVQPVFRVAPGKARQAQKVLTRRWARGMARIIGMRLEVVGSIPTERGLIITNHLSYVDIVALWSAVPGLFVSTHQVSRWPFIGVFARTAGSLFIDRDHASDAHRSISLISEAIEAGNHVILFAEGTTSMGSEVLPLHPPLLEAAIRTGTAVSCGDIGYQVEPGQIPAHLSICWWGDMTFYDHLYALFRMPSFRARIEFLEEPVEAPNRKILAKAARELISQNFRPVVQDAEAEAAALKAHANG